MAKKRSKRLRAALKKFLTAPTPTTSSKSFYMGPKLEPYLTQRYQEMANRPYASRYYQDTPIPDNDETEKMNRDIVEIEKLSQANDALTQSREALDLTLHSQHKLLIATLVTAMAAILAALISSAAALIVAFHSKPPVVYVRPNIIVNRR
jgi:hypothetical protein